VATARGARAHLEPVVGEHGHAVEAGHERAHARPVGPPVELVRLEEPRLDLVHRLGLEVAHHPLHDHVAVRVGRVEPQLLVERIGRRAVDQPARARSERARARARA
jgi:hypothetical protein